MDQPGYTELYNEYRCTLLAYARSYCAYDCIAGDIVHDVFLKLLEKQRLVKDISNWKAYLFIMVRNEAISHLRKQQLQQRGLSEYNRRRQYVTSHDSLLEKEFRQNLRTAIENLPAQQRLVYELRVEYNRKNEEVAAILELSASTVKKHIQQTRYRLRQLVA